MKAKSVSKQFVESAEVSESDSECDSSDEELQEAYASGLLKPGLNVVIKENKKVQNNCVNLMKEKLMEIKLDLSWIERLDMVNAPAPMAPELAFQMQEQETRRARQLKGNRKLPQFDPTEDPVLNDFRRETTFHRQAQGAVLEGIIRLKKLGLPTIRPDDYFAEMAKSDTHMQKIRKLLLRKQVIVQRSEKIRQLRTQKKVAKEMKIETTLKKHADKRKMMDEVKKYRKGIRKDLDFLDDKKKPQSKAMHPKTAAKRKMRDNLYGFGGKKRGSKKNTKDSAADVSEYRRPSKPGKNLKKNGGKVKPRLGKRRRVQNKAKKSK